MLAVRHSYATVPPVGLPASTFQAMPCRIRRLAAGKTLFKAEEAASDLFELTEGVVKLYKLLPDGRCQIIGFVYPGQFVGLLVSASYAYTAEAVTDSAFHVYDRKRLDSAAENDPGLLDRLMTSTSGELKAAQDHMMLLGRKTALERVASFLLTLAGRAPGGSIIDLPMTRQDIGDYLGLTTETVCRALGQLKQQEIVRAVTQRRLLLVRHDDLREIAVGDLDLELAAPGRYSRCQRAVWPA